MQMGYGYGMHYGYGMGLIGLIFWILVIIGLALLIKYLWIHNRQIGKESESALEILKKRYAKGDINKEEFEEKKKDL